MKFYKKTIMEDKDFGKQFSSVNKLARALKKSQPYMHNVMTNKTIITEKQYLKLKKELHKHYEIQTNS